MSYDGVDGILAERKGRTIWPKWSWGNEVMRLSDDRLLIMTSGPFIVHYFDSLQSCRKKCWHKKRIKSSGPFSREILVQHCDISGPGISRVQAIGRCALGDPHFCFVQIRLFSDLRNSRTDGLAWALD